MLNAVRVRCRGIAACISAVLTILVLSRPTHGQSPAQPDPGEANFTVFLRSTPVGSERVDLVRSSNGWTVRSNGQLLPPFSMENLRSEIEYDAEWRPRRLSMEGLRLGRPFTVQTLFDGTSATNTLQEAGQESQESDEIDPMSIVLPNYFFGAYEALAVRLNGSEAGETIPIYAAPRGPINALVREVVDQPLQTAQRSFVARIFRLTFQNPDQDLNADVWVGPTHRLLRVTFPTSGLDVMRRDISSVTTRLAGVTVPGDAQHRVPARGFSLAATVTTPVGREMPVRGWPAVVLVPGIRSTDRDERILGVPIYGRLAGALAENGYLVVRYDRRGVGQSGGRPEAAALEDYAGDVRDVVRYLDDRDDVDRDRIVVVAHGEGGWIGLRAASRENKIAALALIAAPGTTGNSLVLEQQQAQLDRLQTTADEREQRVALQQRIHAAVLEDASWDDVPPEVRRSADTPWFRSFLEYDPADVMRRTRQPLLVVHGMEDRQIAPPHADSLMTLAEMRTRRESTVELAKLEGVNHALVKVQDGATANYGDLATAMLDSSVTSTLIDWLDRTLATTK